MSSTDISSEEEAAYDEYDYYNGDDSLSCGCCACCGCTCYDWEEDDDTSNKT